MAQRLLEGEYENVIDVKEGADSQALRELRAENRRLDEALRGVRSELGQAKADKENLERSIRALRNQLSPLHRYLRALFGEMELAVGEESNPAVPLPAQTASVPKSKWQAIRERYSNSRVGDVIEMLMLHGAMNQSQLAAALRVDPSSVSKNIMPQVKALGLVVKDGDRWNLRD
jgi:FtsZ-binding cell division protein ZapB